MSNRLLSCNLTKNNSKITLKLHVSFVLKNARCLIFFSTSMSGTPADCVSLALSGALFSWSKPVLVGTGAMHKIYHQI